MNKLLKTLDIIIIHREKNGKPDSILPYNGDIAAQLIACVNLARAILVTEEGKKSLISLGNKLDNKPRPDKWYNVELKDVVKRFLDKVMTRWPPLFMEETMENPDHTGATFRAEWGKDFNTRDHPISLNAGRIRGLCQAGRMAKTNDDLNSEEHQCFRRFVYNTAVTLVHEMGHLFITFLNGGESNTPPSEPGGFVYGEAGRDLEFILFGGYHAFIRNPKDIAADAQSGHPHLVERDRDLRKITQKTIDEIVHYEFTFPLPTVPAVKPELAETMGARLPSPGGHSGKNLSNLSNPLFWPETLELFAMHDRLGAKVNQWTTKDRRFLDELCARNKDPMIFQSGPQSAIHHLPFNPSLKPEPVQA